METRQSKDIQFKTVTGTEKLNKEELLSMVLGSISESVWKNTPIDVARIKMVISLFADHPDLKKRVLCVAQDEGKTVALLAAMVTEDNLIGGAMASELMWYVKPEYRRSKIAENLLDMYEKWANDVQIQYVTVSHYNNEIGKVLEKLYKRRGFKPMETSYIKELR